MEQRPPPRTLTRGRSMHTLKKIEKTVPEKKLSLADIFSDKPSRFENSVHIHPESQNRTCSIKRTQNVKLSSKSTNQLARSTGSLDSVTRKFNQKPLSMRRTRSATPHRTPQIKGVSVIESGRARSQPPPQRKLHNALFSFLASHLQKANFKSLPGVRIISSISPDKITLTRSRNTARHKVRRFLNKVAPVAVEKQNSSETTLVEKINPICIVPSDDFDVDEEEESSPPFDEITPPPPEMVPTKSPESKIPLHIMKIQTPRLPPIIEMYIYRLSYFKLLEPRRGVQDRVNITNLMLYLLRVHPGVDYIRPGETDWTRNMPVGDKVTEVGKKAGLIRVQTKRMQRVSSPLRNEIVLPEDKRPSSVYTWSAEMLRNAGAKSDDLRNRSSRSRLERYGTTSRSSIISIESKQSSMDVRAQAVQSDESTSTRERRYWTKGTIEKFKKVWHC